MKALLTIAIFTTLYSTSIAQEGDSLLANERSIDRPLNVHGGQLRVGAQYGIAINSKRFNQNGTSINLSGEGFTSIGHHIFWEVNYGIFEFLQASFLINHLQEGRRERNIFIATSPDNPLNINKIIENKGWDDPVLALDFKVPFQTRSFDAVFTLGRSLTTSAHKPQQPQHQVTTIKDVDHVTYQYFNTAGKGVPALIGGIHLKLRGKNTAFSVRYNHRTYSNEGESTLWLQQMREGKFIYRQDNFSYQLGDEISYHMLFEYQALPFFDIMLGYLKDFTTKGWTESTGRRVLIPEQHYGRLAMGLEIIATPRLWVRQKIELPLAGKNRLAPLFLSTRVIYNLFPFEK